MSDQKSKTINLTRDGQLRLRQYGLSEIEISRLMHNYISSFTEFNERRFLSYCVNANMPMHILSVPSSWAPSPSIVDELKHHGVPDAVITRTIERFKQEQPVKAQSSWDNVYQRFALASWASDPNNPKALVPTLMTRHWTPNDSVVSELLELGFTKTSLDLVVAEYRVFWMEIASKKPNWARHFFWWASTKLNKY